MDEIAGRQWYAVRCVFHNDAGAPIVYEERITLWRAGSIDEATALAEAEAVEYTEESPSPIPGSPRRTGCSTSRATARRSTRSCGTVTCRPTRT